jgi:TolB-like protein/Tfp pilus assembly protein PilF
VIGRKLARYEIREKIGAGGMGDVYRARDMRLQRDVALKVLPVDASFRPERLARFEREAKTVAGLDHPGIVTLFSIEDADGVHFLTMELVEGDTLDRLVRPGGLPLDRLLELAIPIADALGAAHERGVVHRDLKPGNVMVTEDGRVKVLDFGLAKLVAGESPDDPDAPTVTSPISSAGQVLGTVPYMAPEQLRGEDPDPRSDLFSLGVLLYELAAGRRPFRGRTSAEVSSAVLRDPPPPLDGIRPELPPAFVRLVSRCLEKDRGARPASAAEVGGELEKLHATPTAVRATPAVDAGASPAAGDSADLPSVAVLPFANRGRDEDDEYFVDGLADEMINVLAKIRGLRVAAHTSSFRFKGVSEDPAVIGDKLNVATLLEGSVRRAGARLRVSVRLVKVADGFPLWSETYDRTLDDIFAVQDDIAQSVVKELRRTLLGRDPDSGESDEVKAEVADAARGRGGSGEAHRLFLQGRFLIGRHSRDDIPRAIEYLRRAVELEPRHAQAWAWLSRAHSHEAGWGLVSPEEGTRRAREAADHALELEPELSEAHLARGFIQVLHDWDWKEADRTFRRVIELAPGDPVALSMAGIIAYCLGRLDETVDLCRRCLELDPLNAIAYSHLGRAHRAADRLRESEAAFRQALELSPQAVTWRLLLALVLIELGRVEEARKVAEEEPAEWARTCALAIVQHAAGRAEESDRALQELTETSPDHSAYQIAMIHAARGEADAAFDWLERAYDQRDSGLSLLQPEALFRPLHADPRWLPFLRKMGFED